MSSPAARRSFLVAITGLCITGCSGGQTDGSATADTSAPAASAAASAPSDAPDACTFFSRAELEETVGWELREGEKEDAPPGSFQCDFEKPTGMNITRTFPNPPLPQSVGFSSIKVSTGPSDAGTFGEFRQTIGTDAEDIPGVGDAAYFYGPDMLYVRVGNRMFSLRIYTNAGSDADRARVREVMLKLARLGASRLA